MIKLKEQKASTKNLSSKPDFKLLYLVPLRNYVKKINVAFYVKFKREITLGEIKPLSKMAKQLSILKSLFARLTNTKSWYEAQQRFLNLATGETSSDLCVS